MTASTGSHADKRRRILALLGDAKWRMRSTKWLSRFTGCHEMTIRKYRRLYGNDTGDTRLVRKGATVFEMNVSNLVRNHGDAP